MKIYNTLLKPVLSLATITGCLSLGLNASPPTIINDSEVTKDLGDKIGKYVADDKTASVEELVKQLSKTSVELNLPEAGADRLKDLYSDRVGSVGIIASVYKCDKCPNWHRSSFATCWVLTEDGVMVTNYHVMNGKKHDGFGVLTNDGRVAPVVEILAADKRHDIAIFKVAGNGYTPIPLGNAQKVGGEAHIIAHPDSRFFTYTGGQVSRYYNDRNQRDSYWMGVTAEYARGSSGGPVMDEAGNVIGMVASTNSIYAPSKNPDDRQGSFQMVIRNCVPVDQIRKLITKPVEAVKN